MLDPESSLVGTADEERSDASGERIEALLQDLERMERVACRGCKERVCGHEAVMSVALGFKTTPRCAPCLAAAVDQDLAEMTDYLLEYVEHHDCFRAGWDWAGRREGVPRGERPRCISQGRATPPRRSSQTRPARTKEAPMRAGVEWNAGSTGCGDLVLELRIRLCRMRPGQILALTATDPGAREDLPAWCRLTGHHLRKAEHPLYLIERKQED